MLEQCRRCVQQDKCGHRVRKDDPFYAVRRTLRTCWICVSSRRSDSGTVGAAVCHGVSAALEGFAALFRMAMLGIWNPCAHELLRSEDPQPALEYLCFTSVLHWRFDRATVRVQPGRVKS